MNYKIAFRDKRASLERDGTANIYRLCSAWSYGRSDSRNSGGQ
jgi:hypothetical protein